MRSLNYFPSIVVFVLLLCLAASTSNATECEETVDSTFSVPLPALPGHGLDDTITIPNNRPIYALFVHGYSQNVNFDHLLFYNFAKHLIMQFLGSRLLILFIKDSQYQLLQTFLVFKWDIIVVTY